MFIWRFRIESWCEQEFDSTDSIENHVSIENSRSSKLTLILSEINSNIDQNECVLVNILRLNAIMLENIDRLSKIVLQSIKYLRIDNDFINWIKIITRIVWSRSRQAICCRQVVITRSSLSSHEWVEYQTLDCIIANATRDHQVCKTLKVQINRKCESNFDRINMIACKANIESEEMLCAFLCITTSNKSSDLQLKHVARSIRTMKYAKRLYSEESARQLVLQLLV